MAGARRQGSRRLALIVGTSLAVIALAGGTVAAKEGGEEGRDLPIEFLHNNLEDAPVAGAVWAAGPALKNGDAICSTPATNDPNVNVSCEGTGPHNETSIAVNPADPDNLISGANDYQLAINPGGHVAQSTRSRATVSFDGGHSWTVYPIRTTSTYQATGDPAVDFDDAGNAYYATLGFRFVGPANAQNPDVLVSVSKDGGVTWDPHRVAQGSGVGTSVGDLLDKEYVTAWGDGNALVTFGDYRLGHKGAALSGQIFATVTHDAGSTWSAPVLVSGDALFAFVSTPVATADGRIFVAYEDFTHFDNGRDDYAVAELDPDTGARIAGPFKVDTLIDGATDYPIAFGRQTYQDSAFRSWSAGNIAADPTDGDHLAVEWSDMRNSTLPAPGEPVRGGDELRHGRQPVVRRRADVVGPRRDRAAGRPVPGLGHVRRHRAAPGRLLRPLVRPGQPRVRLHPRHRDVAGLAVVLDLGAHDGPLRPDEEQPLVRGDARSRLPVRDVVHRRLLGDRGDAVGRRGRRLDRPPQPGELRRPDGRRPGRVLRHVAVAGDDARGDPGQPVVPAGIGSRR